MLKIIKNSPIKSCLLDPVPTFLLKDCVDILLPPIPKLDNLSLTEGDVPQMLKKAVVAPLKKKASLPSKDLKNYCPVSGLCSMSKLVYRVVVKQLIQRTNGNNLDNPQQSAYKTGHSTDTALLHVKNKIHLTISCGEPAALVLLDLSATFNATDHTNLLNFLSHGLVCAAQLLSCSLIISASDSKQLKLGQPSLNCFSCYLEFHRSQSLVLCCSLYTPLL